MKVLWKIWTAGGDPNGLNPVGFVFCFPPSGVLYETRCSGVPLLVHTRKRLPLIHFTKCLLLAILMAAVLAPLSGCDTTEPLEGFSWVVPGKLAAMPVVGREHSLDQDAAFLEQEGVRVLVSLAEEAPDRQVLASHSIDQQHLPVKDFTPPTLEQMITFVSVVEDSAAAGKPVGVHCTAGLGRSGTMVAAYLVAEGEGAEEAIAKVRYLRPGSIETKEQEEAVRQFEEHLKATR